jgi:uncharacterized protein
MEARTDAELVQAVRDGDRSAFDALVDRHYAAVCQAARRLVGDGAAADIAQEALLEAFLSLRHLRHPAQFAPWMRGIVRNVGLSFLRERRLAGHSLDDAVERLAGETEDGAACRADPHAVLARSHLRGEVRRALADLSGGDGEAARLFYLHQTSLREMALALGISETAAKARLRRARERLRTRLAFLSPEPEPRPSKPRRRKRMIPATTAGVYSKPGQDFQQTVVLLRAECGQTLTIFIGEAEGIGIALALEGVAPTRPLTYDLTLRLLEAAGGAIQEVRIGSLRETIFYATIIVRTAAGTVEIDARPSDAIGLAVRVGCPILVAPEVIEAAAATGESEEPPGEPLRFLPVPPTPPPSAEPETA